MLQNAIIIMSLTEKMCVILIITILASISIPVICKKYKNLKWRISWITQFHNARIGLAAQGYEWNHSYDNGLENGDFWKIMRIVDN